MTEPGAGSLGMPTISECWAVLSTALVDVNPSPDSGSSNSARQGPAYPERVGIEDLTHGTSPYCPCRPKGMGLVIPRVELVIQRALLCERIGRRRGIPKLEMRISPNEVAQTAVHIRIRSANPGDREFGTVGGAVAQRKNARRNNRDVRLDLYSVQRERTHQAGAAHETLLGQRCIFPPPPLAKGNKRPKKRAAPTCSRWPCGSACGMRRDSSPA